MAKLERINARSYIMVHVVKFGSKGLKRFVC